MPFLYSDPRDLSNSSLLSGDDSVFFKSATKFTSQTYNPYTTPQSGAGSNLPRGSAAQYENAFTDATGNPNYTPGVPVFVTGAHTLKNGGVHFQKINVFEDLQSHWEGSSTYARYRYVSNQRGGRKIKSSLIPTNLPENTPNNIELMKKGGGALSFLTGSPDRIVMDLVFYLDGNFRCPLPSPISGKIKSVGSGTENSTKIEGDEGSVRMLHMDNFLVQKGEEVVEGQIIGIQSDIMSHKPPNVHLHFEAPENIMRRYIKKMLDGSYSGGANTQPNSTVETFETAATSDSNWVKNSDGTWSQK
jgi:hypothetical protein